MSLKSGGTWRCGLKTSPFSWCMERNGFSQHWVICRSFLFHFKSTLTEVRLKRHVFVIISSALIYLFTYLTFCGWPVAPASNSRSLSWQFFILSSATLQQKACASLTRLCHRYAPNCQLSHKEKIGGEAPVRAAATFPLASCHAW